MHPKLLPFAGPRVDVPALPPTLAKAAPGQVNTPLRADAPIASGAAAVPARQALEAKLDELARRRSPSTSFAILGGLEAAFELHGATLSGAAREEVRRMAFARLVEGPLLFIDVARAADRADPMAAYDEAVKGPRPSPPPPLPLISTRAELAKALEQAELQPDAAYRTLQTLLATAGYLKATLQPKPSELAFAGQQFWGDHTKLPLFPLELGRAGNPPAGATASLSAPGPDAFMTAVRHEQGEQQKEARALVQQQPRSSLEAEDWAWADKRLAFLPLESAALTRSIERAAQAIEPSRAEGTSERVTKVAAAISALEPWAMVRKAPPAERTQAALAAIAELPEGALPKAAHDLLSDASRRASENLLRTSGRAGQGFSVRCVPTPPGDVKDAARALLDLANRAAEKSPQALVAPYGQGVLVAFPGQDLATVERSYSGKPEAIASSALVAVRLERAFSVSAGHRAVAQASERPARSGATVLEQCTSTFGAIDLRAPELMRSLTHPREIFDVVSELYAREQKAGREPGLVLDALIEGLDAGFARRGTAEQWTAAIDRAPFVNDLRQRRLAAAISLAANHPESTDLGRLIQQTQRVLGASSPAEQARVEEALSELLQRHQAQELRAEDPVAAKRRLIALVTPLAVG